jgi:hypothetical protein
MLMQAIIDPWQQGNVERTFQAHEIMESIICMNAGQMAHHMKGTRNGH